MRAVKAISSHLSLGTGLSRQLREGTIVLGTAKAALAHGRDTIHDGRIDAALVGSAIVPEVIADEKEKKLPEMRIFCIQYPHVVSFVATLVSIVLGFNEEARSSSEARKHILQAAEKLSREKE